jgi:hypothetical protein
VEVEVFFDPLLTQHLVAPRTFAAEYFYRVLSHAPERAISTTHAMKYLQSSRVK